MMIDRINRTVKALLNTDGRGNFKPSDFEDFLYMSIMEKVESYIYEINQAVNRENRGLVNSGLENIPDRLREKLSHLLKKGTISITSGSGNIPLDCLYFDTILTAAGDELEYCKSPKEFNLYSRNSATADFPIFLKVGNTISVSPQNLPGGPLVFWYIRKPEYPRWTFVQSSGNPIFNPDAPDFKDVDLHSSEEDDLVYMVCLKFGLNLKENDVQSLLANMQQQEENKNLTS
mgnify:CR=1 FL=1